MDPSQISTQAEKCSSRAASISHRMKSMLYGQVLIASWNTE